MNSFKKNTIFTLISMFLCFSAFSSTTIKKEDFDTRKAFCYSGFNHLDKNYYKPRYYCDGPILRRSSASMVSSYGVCLSVSEDKKSYVTNQFILEKYFEDDGSFYFKKRNKFRFYKKRSSKDLAYERINEIELLNKKKQKYRTAFNKKYDFVFSKKTNSVEIDPSEVFLRFQHLAQEDVVKLKCTNLFKQKKLTKPN